MKSPVRFLRILLLLGASLPFLFGAERSAAGPEFDRIAWSALPTEESQAFRDVLIKDFDGSLRDPAAKATSTEIEIPDQGWLLVYSAQSGPVIKQAVTEFQTHLKTSMQV